MNDRLAVYLNLTLWPLALGIAAAWAWWVRATG